MDEFLYEMERDQKALRKEIIEIMWHMRGSLSRDEAWALSMKEREEFIEYIGERMKLVEKTKLPII